MRRNGRTLRDVLGDVTRVIIALRLCPSASRIQYQRPTVTIWDDGGGVRVIEDSVDVDGFIRKDVAPHVTRSTHGTYPTVQPMSPISIIVGLNVDRSRRKGTRTTERAGVAGVIQG